MPSKKDLLESLTVRELRGLAKAFRVPLIKKSSLFGLVDLK